MLLFDEVDSIWSTRPTRSPFRMAESFLGSDFSASIDVPITMGTPLKVVSS